MVVEKHRTNDHTSPGSLQIIQPVLLHDLIIFNLIIFLNLGEIHEGLIPFRKFRDQGFRHDIDAILFTIVCKQVQ